MLTTTARQKDVYDFIREFIDENKYGPSYQEIQNALGLNSKSGVHRMVQCLKDRGLINTLPGKPRCISLKQAVDGEYHLRRVLSAIKGSPASNNAAVKAAARYLAGTT